MSFDFYVVLSKISLKCVLHCFILRFFLSWIYFGIVDLNNSEFSVSFSFHSVHVYIIALKTDGKTKKIKSLLYF